MKRPLQGNLLLLCCFLLLQAVLCRPVPASGREAARIDGIVVMNSEHDLLLYCTLRDAFSDEMVKGIENGIPVTFSFFIELYRLSAGGAEQKLSGRAFDHTLNYDPLKQEYTVEREEIRAGGISFKSFAEAEAAMADIHDLPLAGLARLETDGRYMVKVKARLAKKVLPVNFQYILPFWQLWNFETEWHTLSFIYGNPGSAAER